jgi:transmembrane sensor
MFRGEAFFTVAHNKDRPFVVTTRDGTALDAGTSFNVRVEADWTIVSLVEGKVDVSASGNLASKVDRRRYPASIIASEADRSDFIPKNCSR